MMMTILLAATVVGLAYRHVGGVEQLRFATYLPEQLRFILTKYLRFDGSNETGTKIEQAAIWQLKLFSQIKYNYAPSMGPSSLN